MKLIKNPAATKISKRKEIKINFLLVKILTCREIQIIFLILNLDRAPAFDSRRYYAIA